MIDYCFYDTDFMMLDDYSAEDIVKSGVNDELEYMRGCGSQISKVCRKSTIWKRTTAGFDRLDGLNYGWALQLV